jgi:predicted PurR-regulated permease PerM
MSIDDERDSARRLLETTLRVGFVLGLVVWCFLLAGPFFQPFFWGIILAISAQPVYARLSRAAGGRRALAASLLVVAALLILIVPAALFTTSLIESATQLAEAIDAGTVEVPPPPDGVADWPLVGEPVHRFWSAASQNLDTALDPLHPQLKAVGRWALETGASAGIGLLLFSLSIVIAGVLLTSGASAAEPVRKVAGRLVPGRGGELVDLTGQTIQSVTRGILGTAVIQAVLAGIGLVAADVPAFGLWVLLVLLLAVVQIPTMLVLAPIIVWVFASSSPLVAIPFAIWSTAVGMSDNVLKPLLLGRGASVPMLVIFVGAIGGFIRAGIIGLFVGAVVMAVGYTLFKWWLNDGRQDAAIEPV